jgi:hypothetical protein
MKPTLFLLIVAASLTISSYAQKIHVSVKSPDGTEEYDLLNEKDQEVPKETKELKSIVLLSNDLPASDKLQITVGGVTKDYDTPGKEKTIDFGINILNKDFVIKHLDKNGAEVGGNTLKFRFIAKVDKPDPGKKDKTLIQPSIDDYLLKNYDGLESTPFGYIDPTEKERRIHIFFDHFGNSLISTIPSGISNAQYVVHIIYPISFAEPNIVSYSVKQKSGSFSSALLFNNTNTRTDISGFFQSGEKYDAITERRFLLGTSTDDLTFDIIAATNDNQITKAVLGNYTIKMSPVYHGSFDVGFVKTDLSNPTYSLTPLPNSTNKVVKQTDESPKGVVTVMASFYVSPVVLLQSFFGKKNIPFYKLTGRNFLDDHKFYERFYPTIGVGVSDKAFENFFYGMNWEVARGLSIFGGWHYGKVNTFDMPDFEMGVTPVAEDQFEFYKNKKWKTSTAFGVKLDMLIVRNLFSAAAAK